MHPVVFNSRNIGRHENKHKHTHTKWNENYPAHLSRSSAWSQTYLWADEVKCLNLALLLDYWSCRDPRPRWQSSAQPKCRTNTFKSVSFTWHVLHGVTLSVSGTTVHVKDRYKNGKNYEVCQMSCTEVCALCVAMAVPCHYVNVSLAFSSLTLRDSVWVTDWILSLTLAFITHMHRAR